MVSSPSISTDGIPRYVVSCDSMLVYERASSHSLSFNRGDAAMYSSNADCLWIDPCVLFILFVCYISEDKRGDSKYGLPANTSDEEWEADMSNKSGRGTGKIPIRLMKSDSSHSHFMTTNDSCASLALGIKRGVVDFDRTFQVLQAFKLRRRVSCV